MKYYQGCFCDLLAYDGAKFTKIGCANFADVKEAIGG